MITARNYASQVEKACTTFNQMYTDYKWHEDAKFFAMMKMAIKTGEHFAMPDGGLILNDRLKGMCNENWKLPYPVTVIEYYIDEKGVEDKVLTHKASKRLIVAVQGKDGIKVCGFYSLDGIWVSTPATITVPKNWWDTTGLNNPLSDLSEIRKNQVNNDVPICISSLDIKQPHIFKQLEATCGEVQAKKLVLHELVSEARIVLELVEALTCRNVYTETLEPIDEKTNQKRIKKGKLPLYETKILVVDSAPKTVDKTWKGGTHASPRQHLRRGHIRRYSTYNIWINNTIVGKAENGIIEKSYSVI